MTASSLSAYAPPNWQAAWQRHSRSVKATQNMAKALGAQVGRGTIIGLMGPMGAGKTTFVQGLAEGWGVDNVADVTSPTYTLVNVYAAARGPLAHLDLYRLTDLDSAIGLGLEETLADANGLVIVEWADHLPELMPEHTVWLRLSRTAEKHRLLEGVGLSPPAQRSAR